MAENPPKPPHTPTLRLGPRTLRLDDIFEQQQSKPQQSATVFGDDFGELELRQPSQPETSDVFNFDFQAPETAWQASSETDHSAENPPSEDRPEFNFTPQEKEVKYDGMYLIENDFLPQDIAPYSDVVRQISPVVVVIPYQVWESSSSSPTGEKKSFVLSRPAVHVKNMKDVPLISYLRRSNDLQTLIAQDKHNAKNTSSSVIDGQLNDGRSLDKKVAQLACNSDRIHARILPLTASSVVAWQLFQLNAQVIRNKAYEAKNQHEFFEIPWFNVKNGESIERALGLIPRDWINNIPGIRKRIDHVLTKGRNLEVAVDPYTAITTDHKTALLNNPSFRTFLLNAIKNSYWCVSEASVTQGTGKFDFKTLPYPFVFPGALLLYYPVNPPFSIRMYPVLYSGDTSALIDTNVAFFALGEILRVYSIPAQVIEELKEIYQTSVSFVVKTSQKKDNAATPTRLDQMYIDRIYTFFTKTLPESLRKTLDMQANATGQRALVYRQADEDIVFGYSELETFIKSLGTRLLLHTEFDMSNEQNAKKLQEIAQISLRKMEAPKNTEPSGGSLLGALKNLFGKKPGK